MSLRTDDIVPKSTLPCSSYSGETPPGCTCWWQLLRAPRVLLCTPPAWWSPRGGSASQFRIVLSDLNSKPNQLPSCLWNLGQVQSTLTQAVEAQTQALPMIYAHMVWTAFTWSTAGSTNVPMRSGIAFISASLPPTSSMLVTVKLLRYTFTCTNRLQLNQACG